MSALNIRRALVEDADLLARLSAAAQQIHHEARPDFFKPPAVSAELVAEFHKRLLDDQVTIFIGEVNGEPVGCVVAQIVERSESPYAYAQRALLVDQVAVNADQRSKGYGEQLMQQVFDLAMSRGIRTVLLTVWAFNQRAVAFYERQGFAVRDVRMELTL